VNFDGDAAAETNADKETACKLAGMISAKA
jgi:hypothetical protein